MTPNHPSGKCWELLNALTGAGAMSIREAARRAERDVKAVHGDVTALLNAGLLSKTDDGVLFELLFQTALLGQGLHAARTIGDKNMSPVSLPGIGTKPHELGNQLQRHSHFLQSRYIRA